MTRLLVIGGGITGLAAAWEASARQDVDVTVVESEQRFGGKLLSSPVPGLDAAMVVDEGADAFLARVPDAVELCHELELDDELTQPAATRAMVHTPTGAKFLPAGTVLGVPVEFEPLARSGLISNAGLRRAAEEPSGRWTAPEVDVSIGAFLTERYGRELVDNVVAPLIGGINAGDVDLLSLAAVTPQLAAAAAAGGSLTAELARRAAAAPPDGAPVFRALLGGSERLVEALRDALVERGVELVDSTPVQALHLTGEADGSMQAISAERDFVADHIVVCTPASHAAGLLEPLSPSAASLLGEINYSSVALVTMVFERAALGSLDPQVSGVLVPRGTGMLMTAASIGSSKWPHWNDGTHVVVRTSAGHSRDGRGMTLSDHELLAGLAADLRSTLGVDSAPLGTRISRWNQGFAQYEVGHLDRVAAVEDALEVDCPSVLIGGASYRGLGIPACISQGRAAVRRLLG